MIAVVIELVFWAVCAALTVTLVVCTFAACALSSRLSRAEEARDAEHAGERWLKSA